MNLRILPSFLLLPLLLLGGCTMAPKYQRPAAPVARQWPSQPAGSATLAHATNTLPAADIGWRDFFNDPRLLRLIELSLTNNRDLRVAALNIEQTRAQYRIQRSELLPAINGNAGLTRQRIPAGLNGVDRSILFTSYSVSASLAAYEVDLFGRVRSLNQAALNRFFSSIENRRSVHISLVAEVAVQYLTERELQEQLAITRDTLKAVESSYELNRRSFENGVASELDLRAAEAQVQTARANVATLEQLRAQAENALGLLVGQPLLTDLPSPMPLDKQDLVQDLPPGVPAEVLQRRPDIMAAEYQLKAANANIGAARAAFFPKVLLTGAVGYASLGLQDLFTGPALAWNFSPQITVPIFQGGANRANLDVAQVRKQIEVATYEQAIQRAFREVADALVARTMLEQRIAAQQALVEAEQKRYNLAEMRYRGGVDSYINVLSAQQDLYNAQQALVQSRTSRLTNLVNLYRALGGGWEEQMVTTASAK